MSAIGIALSLLFSVSEVMLRSMPFMMTNIRAPSTNSTTAITHTTHHCCQCYSYSATVTLLTAVKAATIAALTAANAGIATTTLLRPNVDFIMALVIALMKSFFLTSIGLYCILLMVESRQVSSAVD